jgi:signal transduction histidine kinase/HAMP domain-containing protein
MRGGLGRTLLTAFLILTIVPVALIGWYALWQNRRSLEDEVIQKLQAVATLKAQTISSWWEERRAFLTADIVASVAAPSSTATWEDLQAQVPDLAGISLLDARSEVIWSVGSCDVPLRPLVTLSSLAPHEIVGLSQVRGDETLLVCYYWDFERGGREMDEILGESGRIYLVQPSAGWRAETDERTPALRAQAAGEAWGGVYTNPRGVPVVGAYQPFSDGEMGVLVEQEQAEVLASTERMAATLIGVVLTMVLATTVIAGVMIRQITRPVIRLTESALVMADGNLNQSVAVSSRDEIGILTYVFNQMAAELKSLYDHLEAKVAERTQMLQEANYQLQRRAMQLEASLKVSEAVTSIRDPAVLLTRVTDLICARFVFTSVAIYLTEPGGGQAQLRAVSPENVNWPEQVHTGDGSLMERALRKAEPQLEHWDILQNAKWSQRTVSHVVVPLKMEKRVIGVLAVMNTERERVQKDDIEVLVQVANQITVALENARAYERERLAARRLEEAEVFKARFLANMSHTLREPLNSISGFSRLMLKGFDGDLTTQQRQDVERIYDNSQRLLERINDILTTSQIQAGLMELQLQPVNLAEIAESVAPTAEAMVRGKDIQLHYNIAEDLPFVHADATRMRQVLVHLLGNAAKFTEEGEIAVRMWADGEQAYVSVSDTGIGITEEDCERIFRRFETGSGMRKQLYGAGLGLALSKEFVEMHGGRMWVTSEMGQGSTFTFSVPLYTPLNAMNGRHA